MNTIREKIESDMEGSICFSLSDAGEVEGCMSNNTVAHAHKDKNGWWVEVECLDCEHKYETRVKYVNKIGWTYEESEVVI